MSAQYDLYETPDPANTGEQKPLHARIVANGTYSKKEFMERVSRSSPVLIMCICALPKSSKGRLSVK